MEMCSEWYRSAGRLAVRSDGCQVKISRRDNSVKLSNNEGQLSFKEMKISEKGISLNENAYFY